MDHAGLQQDCASDHPDSGACEECRMAVNPKRRTAFEIDLHRQAAPDRLGECLLDPNRTIGQSNKITLILGRKITEQHRGKLPIEITCTCPTLPSATITVTAISATT